jgi:hypothetical protein
MSVGATTPRVLVYCGVAVLWGSLLVGCFRIFVRDAAALALLALAAGSIGWGMAARAVRTSRTALVVIGVVVGLMVSYEFKRVYVLDYAGRRPPPSLAEFADSLFVSDIVFIALPIGAALLGWHWQGRHGVGGAQQQP